jgi:hypothetical protein
MDINFNNIEKVTKDIFQETTQKKYDSIKLLINALQKLKENQFSLYEVLKNDFEYYWNQLQVRYYLETGTFVQISSKISKLPAVWLKTWVECLQNEKNFYQVKNKNLRKIPFEKTMVEVKKLESILEFITEINDKSLEKFYQFKKILPMVDSKNHKEIFQNNMINFIYDLAFLKKFQKVMNPEIEKKMFKRVLEIYYGKYLMKYDKEKDFFNKYYPKPKDILTDKENYFMIRDEDFSYWLLYSQLSNDFEQHLINMIDFSESRNMPSIAKKIKIQHQYLLLENNMVGKKEEINKNQKI